MRDQRAEFYLISSNLILFRQGGCIQLRTHLPQKQRMATAPCGLVGFTNLKVTTVTVNRLYSWVQRRSIYTSLVVIQLPVRLTDDLSTQPTFDSHDSEQDKVTRPRNGSLPLAPFENAATPPGAITAQ